MEKICIVKRRKSGDGGALAPPAVHRPGGAPRPGPGVLSIALTPEQALVLGSSEQFQQLYGGEVHAVIFNLHLSDALPPRLLNPRVLSEMLGVSRRTVLKLTRDGVLRGYKIGRLRRYAVEDVMA